MDSLLESLYGRDNAVHICAEIGQNHNGSEFEAIKLAEIAYECGCDSAKITVRCEFPDTWDVPYNVSKRYRFGKTYLEHREKLELSKDSILRIGDFCRKISIPFGLGFGDKTAYERILSSEYGDVDFLKVPSSQFGKNFISRNGNFCRFVVASCGMSVDSDVRSFIAKVCPDIILQCTSSYPCLSKDLNLGYISNLLQYQRLFNRSIRRVGLSIHSNYNIPIMLAIGLGARWIEIHITTNTRNRGRDHKFSYGPSVLKKLVSQIRMAEKCLGDGIKTVMPCEEDSVRKLKNNII